MESYVCFVYKLQECKKKIKVWARERCNVSNLIRMEEGNLVTTDNRLRECPLDLVAGEEERACRSRLDKLYKAEEQFMWQQSRIS